MGTSPFPVSRVITTLLEPFGPCKFLQSLLYTYPNAVFHLWYILYSIVLYADEHLCVYDPEELVMLLYPLFFFVPLVPFVFAPVLYVPERLANKLVLGEVEHLLGCGIEHPQRSEAQSEAKAKASGIEVIASCRRRCLHVPKKGHAVEAKARKRCRHIKDHWRKIARSTTKIQFSLCLSLSLYFMLLAYSILIVTVLLYVLSLYYFMWP